MGFPYLLMEVITYTDLWERAAVVVEFIDRVLETFEPFQTKLECMAWSRWKSAVNRPRISSFKLDSRKWTETRQLVLEGQLGILILYDWASIHTYGRVSDRDAYLGIEFGFPEVESLAPRTQARFIFDPRKAKKVNFCISTRAWNGGVPVEVQEQTVSLARDLFQAVDGACGYVDVGDHCITLVSRTPFEHSLSMTEPNTRRLWRDVRGVFWGNLLSTQHVQRLGGVSAIEQKAVRYSAEVLASPGREGTDSAPMYLQANCDLRQVTSEDLAGLTSLLAPILISSQDQTRVTVLDQPLVAHLGGQPHLEQALAGAGKRVSSLPCGALLIEYAIPAGWPDAYRALKQAGCGMARGYRSIPQLQSLIYPDDAAVWTLEDLAPSQPKARYPIVVASHGIRSEAVRIRICLAGVEVENVSSRLESLFQEWSVLGYDTASGTKVISCCAVAERGNDWITYHLDLTPVGQDAYIQLVLMLDEFSRTAAPIDRIEVDAWYP